MKLIKFASGGRAEAKGMRLIAIICGREVTIVSPEANIPGRIVFVRDGMGWDVFIKIARQLPMSHGENLLLKNSMLMRLLLETEAMDSIYLFRLQEHFCVVE